MYGVILVAAFIALFESKKGSNTAKERFEGVSLYKWSCCGKVYKNRVTFAIHTKKSHGKCCYLETVDMSAQCNDCHFKYTKRSSCHETWGI